MSVDRIHCNFARTSAGKVTKIRLYSLPICLFPCGFLVKPARFRVGIYYEYYARLGQSHDELSVDSAAHFPTGPLAIRSVMGLTLSVG